MTRTWFTTRKQAARLLVALCMVLVAYGLSLYIQVRYVNSTRGVQLLLQRGNVCFAQWTGTRDKGNWGVSGVTDGLSVECLRPNATMFGTRTSGALEFWSFDLGYLVVPLSALMFFPLLWILLTWHFWGSDAPRLCHKCGYEVAGLNRCPECGTPHMAKMQETNPPSTPD